MILPADMLLFFLMKSFSVFYNIYLYLFADIFADIADIYADIYIVRLMQAGWNRI